MGEKINLDATVEMDVSDGVVDESDRLKLGTQQSEPAVPF